MVDIINYNITFVKDKTVKPEESFIHTYVDERFESDSAISSMCQMRIIIDANYEKSNLNKVMTKQCQHINATELYRLINILKKFENMFDGMLCTWKTTSVDLELKDDEKPVCSRTYPVLNVLKAMFKNEVKILVSLGVLEEDNDFE